MSVRSRISTAHTARNEKPPELGRGGFARLRAVRTDLPMLREESLATVLVRDSDPATGLANDLSLGRLQSPSRAGSLPRRTVVLLELAQGPPQRGSLPSSAANTTRRDARIVERKLGLLSTFRAAPSHQPTLPRRRRPPPVPDQPLNYRGRARTPHNARRELAPAAACTRRIRSRPRRRRPARPHALPPRRTPRNLRTPS